MPKLRPSGGYRDLRTFQIATIIYDATYWFCERCLDPQSRTSDSMVQAAMPKASPPLTQPPCRSGMRIAC